MVKDFKIPKVIYQTYYDKSKIPQKVYRNLEKYAKGYKMVLFDDKECFEFIKQHFSLKLAKRFNKIECGAHKADLFRYCVLYIKGGIYLDIKTQLIKPINEIFTHNYLYTVLSINDQTIFQAVIASPPRNEIFLKLINYISRHYPSYYLEYTVDFYNKIKQRVDKKNVVEGLNEMRDKYKEIPIFLFRENCSHNISACKGENKYGLCCFIHDKQKKKIIKVRYNDFGKKW